jgi:hypothetical protein
VSGETQAGVKELISPEKWMSIGNNVKLMRSHSLDSILKIIVNLKH